MLKWSVLGCQLLQEVFRHPMHHWSHLQGAKNWENVRVRNRRKDKGWGDLALEGPMDSYKWDLYRKTEIYKTCGIIWTHRTWFRSIRVSLLSSNHTTQISKNRKTYGVWNGQVWHLKELYIANRFHQLMHYLATGIHILELITGY